ncbi:MAG: glycosyltransferase family 8 protein [Sphingobacteriaceae bacterium]
MNSHQRITVVTVCDNHYLILLAALIKSIEANHKTPEVIDMYVVGDQLTDKNKNKLALSVDPKITVLHWLNMEEVIPKHIKIPRDRGSYPLNIYMRLFIPYFIPKEIDKVLYMDVDMIAQEDISKLWKTELHDHPIAAVTDTTIKNIGCSWGGISNYKDLGLNPDGKYFNSGLMLFNTRIWRRDDLTTKIINCIWKNKKFAQYPDQYGCNVVMADQWLELDGRWNFNIGVEETQKPYLLHFIHRKPIYKSYDHKSIYKDTFNHYLSLTEWRDAKPIGESHRYLKKIKNILQKFR